MLFFDNSSWLSCLLAAVWLAALLSQASQASQVKVSVEKLKQDEIPQVAEPEPRHQSISSARERFQPQRLFDFELYKNVFKRVYKGAVEETVRRKYVLARSMRAWISSIKYKFRRISFYLAINNLSDKSPEELERRSNTNQWEPSMVAGELDEPARVPTEKIRLRRMVDQLMMGRRGGSPEEEEQEERQCPREDNITRMSWYKVKAPEQESPQPNPVASMFSGMWKSLTGGNQEGDPQQEQAPDEVFVDHRQSRCMVEPKDQGECASCYAFAVTAIAEWLHCKQTGKLLAFSEQYMIDCGSPHLNSGCQGGNRFMAGDFVHNYGLELLDSYPYRGEAGQCPYADDTEPEEMGAIRMELRTGVRVPLERFEAYIDKGPMYVGLSVKKSAFYEYGGGVLDGVRCEKISWHAVTLIGHGREDGKEYWLIRNSDSVRWGEKGHMKLAKRASKCIPESFGLLYGTRNGREFSVEPTENDKNNQTTIRSHQLKYLGQPNASSTQTTVI